MSAIILTFLPYLFQGAKLIPELWDFIQKLRANLKQTGAWTKEQEEAFDKELEKLENDPPAWWKPEGK